MDRANAFDDTRQLSARDGNDLARVIRFFSESSVHTINSLLA
jgi:hypothetical protein